MLRLPWSIFFLNCLTKDRDWPVCLSFGAKGAERDCNQRTEDWRKQSFVRCQSSGLLPQLWFSCTNQELQTFSSCKTPSWHSVQCVSCKPTCCFNLSCLVLNCLSEGAVSAYLSKSGEFPLQSSFSIWTTFVPATQCGQKHGCRISSTKGVIHVWLSRELCL